MTHEAEAVELPEGGEHATIATICLKIVEQYQGGNICKGDAIYKFTKTIPDGETDAAESPGKTLESYIAMLDNWDRERTLSDTDERRGIRGRTYTGIERKRHKRAEGDEGDDDDDEWDETVHKRSRIDPDQFPWATSDKTEGRTLRDECTATRNLIANYTLDVKLAKAHLLNSGSAPEFPDTEWRSILLGLAVNLDTVFSGRYSTEH